jgi:hypothetical protein
MLAVSALALTACGSTSSGATAPQPAAPVVLTVYIDNSAVSVSPNSAGAGPVTFIITNQASQAESLSILGSSDGKSLANTGPINPQATAQVTVGFTSQGTYSLSTGGGTKATTIRVGPQRSNSDNQVLQP